MKKKIIYMVSTILLLTGCSNIDNNESPKLSKDYQYMDTYITVNLYNIEESKANLIFGEIDSIYKEYHELTSRYDSYIGVNNIFYINNHPNEEIILNDKLLDILAFSINMNNETNGLTNVALGNLIDKWRYLKDEQISPRLDLFKDLESVSIDDIIINNKIVIVKNGVSIDLGAISKGYTTEIVGNYIESTGVDSYLINAGGNVKTGKHYKNAKFVIGIEDPFIQDSIYKKVKLESLSVVTSGGYLRFFDINGTKYHHIIKEESKFPPDYMEAITIICKDSGVADALSTMYFQMDPILAMASINNRLGVEAIIILKDGNTLMSAGFGSYE